MKSSNQEKTIRRKTRSRVKTRGTQMRPRLTAFRSNRHIFAQIIDDESGRTLFGLSDREFLKAKRGQKKSELAKNFGKKFAQLAKEKDLSKVVFDRSGYVYHGRIKAFAEGAREGGLEF